MNNIDIYPTMYGLDLAVCNTKCSNNDIKKYFVKLSKEELTDNDLNHDCRGYTINLLSRKDYTPTALVRILNVRSKTKKGRDIDLLNTITHEATHVLLDTYSKMEENISLDYQEPAAYYMGWIVGNIYKTYFKNK
jgi:hypothetical protein|nr:MAG TPA: peptidase [Caudoviricetes sp.]